MNINNYYNKVADSYMTNGLGTSRYLKNEVEKLFQSLPPKSLIVDAGCGPGDEAEIAIKYGHQVIGIDISEGMIDLFQKRFPDASGVISDLTNISLVNHTADVVFSAFAIIHLQPNEFKKTLKEFRRILKPKGTLILITAIGNNETHHYVHKAFQAMEVSPIAFYFWKKEDLITSVKDGGFSEVKFEVTPIFEGGPETIILRAELF